MSRKIFHRFINLFLLLGIAIVLAACTQVTAVDTSSPSITATVIPPTIPPTNTPTASTEPAQPATATATPASTPAPTCPEPTPGTILLRQERMGYCLLYPDDIFEVQTDPTQVCLAPSVTIMACHSAQVFFNVEDAAGRSVSQVADEMAARGGIIGEPSSLTIAGEEAVLFPEVGGQASTRVVIAVHDDRLYSLAFGLPDPADPISVETFDRLYKTVIDSFTFLPIPSRPEPIKSTQGARGSAVIAYIKDGDLLVWEEATGQSQTVFDSGDVVRVELSGDGQLVAFVRRTLLDGDPRYGRSALWVVERDGSNPRELVSDVQLRASLGASDSDDTDFPALAWIPDSHCLLYSITFFPAYGGGAQGLYLLDVDSQASAELVPAEVSTDFASSPDGEQIAVITPDELFFVSVEDSLAGEVVFTYPAGGVPGGGMYNLGDPSSLRAWTQDSSAVLVRRVIGPGQVFTIWRVPVDGSPAQSLITLRGEYEQFAPDGSTVTFVRGTGPGGIAERFAVPLPEEVGPLAVVRDAIGLSWSPGGLAYVFGLGQETVLPLCPNAAQAIEVCGPPIRFGEPIASFEWLDRNRFLYVTSVPRRLMLGSLDGSATLIAEDPQDPLSVDAVASTCDDNSEFVTDVTVPDGTHFAPNTVFQKTWRVRNTGTCTWDATYRLTFISGDRMFGPRSAPLGETVQPGEEVDVSVTLIAPETAGTYQGQWQLFAPDATPFGTNVYVAIVVP